MNLKSRLFFLLTMVLVLSWSEVSATTHNYNFNGRVMSISEQLMIVGKKDFPLAHNVRVFDQVRRDGAYYLERSRLSRVSVGDSVTVKVDGAYVVEIVIERWK
jgi:hypothetical protein